MFKCFLSFFQDIEHYILIVSASDAGDPPLTATTTIYVNVKDVNDNPPDIEKTVYEINVAENVDVGASIMHIHVTDKDSGNARRPVLSMLFTLLVPSPLMT